LLFEIKTASRVKQKLHTQARQNKESIHYFPSAGRCSTTSRKARLHHLWRLFGKTDVIIQKPPFSSFFPPAFIAKHDIICYGISFLSIWVSYPSCVHSQIFVHPQLAGVVRETGKVLMLCEHCSARTKSVLSTLL